MNDRRKLAQKGLLVLVMGAMILGQAFAGTPVENCPNSANRSSWLYDSPLDVFEEISALGNDGFQYSYNFVNTDTDTIWHFGVWTTFEILEPWTPWVDRPGWNAIYGSMESCCPAYNATDLDPDIISSGLTWYGTGNYPQPGHGIAPGEFVHGFSFVGAELDLSPKFYYFETLTSGWGCDTGSVAAVGVTIPQVVENEPMGLCQIKALYR
jgi:hypothetical protein